MADTKNSDNMLADFMRSIEGKTDDQGSDSGSSTGSTTLAPRAAETKPAAPQNDEKLLSEIKDSITDMQNRMQSAYQSLQTRTVKGYSKDKKVAAEFSATYEYRGIEFGTDALEGGVDAFKNRINEAMKDSTEKVQKITQEQTLELLQSMQVPENIRNMGGNGGGNLQ